MKNQPKNASEAITQHLLTQKSIDPKTALQKYGCMRLSARIFDLRRKGYNIKTENIPFETMFAEKGFYAKYTLISAPKSK